uniref:Disintegrin domain-containing protein n=1 Tax=Macrostomum lignano TaxID=282301 RepID=A0A1I8F7E1_9PLAT
FKSRKGRAQGRGLTSSSAELGLSSRQRAAAPTPYPSSCCLTDGAPNGSPSTPWGPSPAPSGGAPPAATRVLAIPVIGRPRCSRARTGRWLAGVRGEFRWVSGAGKSVGVLCDGGRPSEAASADGKCDRRNCSGGTRPALLPSLRACPGCQRRCPRGFLLVFPAPAPRTWPCHVTASSLAGVADPRSAVSLRAASRDAEAVAVEGVPEGLSGWQNSTPPGVECKSKCPGPNFAQAAEDCRCDCSMRCRPGMALNKAACECRESTSGFGSSSASQTMLDCLSFMVKEGDPTFVSCDEIQQSSWAVGSNVCSHKRQMRTLSACCFGSIVHQNSKYSTGGAGPVVPKLCPDGQVLFRDVCKRGDSCPKGYELRRDRKCYRTGCDPGFKRTKEGGCKKS